jgi:hypothetical protein
VLRRPLGFNLHRDRYLFVDALGSRAGQPAKLGMLNYERLSPWDAAFVLRQLVHTPAHDSQTRRLVRELAGALPVDSRARAFSQSPLSTPTPRDVEESLIKGLGRSGPGDPDGVARFATYHLLRAERPAAPPPPLDPGKEAREKIEAAEKAPRGFVVVEAVTDEEKPLPVPGLRLELLLANGEVRTATTDLAGQVRVEPIPQGECHIMVPGLDGSAWRPAEGSSSPVRGGTSRVQWHTVKRGESLSKIAHHYGVANWQKLWNHAKNEPLRKKRKDPNVLLVGDQVAIADVVVHEVIKATDQVHRIKITQREIRVRLRLQDLARKPWAGVEYDYSYEHRDTRIEKPGSAPTNDEGFLEASVPITVRELTVFLRKQKLRMVLEVDALDPAQDADSQQPVVSGVVMRLAGLGYSPGVEGAEWTERQSLALAEFQADEFGADRATGQRDADTLEALERGYGV